MSSVCYAFHQNPNINPRTGRKIDQNAKTYNDLIKECGNPPHQTAYISTSTSSYIQEEEQIPCLVEEQIAEFADELQYRIFSTIYNKYLSTDKIFEKNRNKIVFMRNTHQITDQGFRNLMNVINLWEQEYHRIGDNVTNIRQFSDKQGGLNRSIVEPEDWAQVIMKLTDTITLFTRDLDLAININTNPQTLKRECTTTSVNKCTPPCIIDKGFFTSDKCDYLPK